jgi:hypothetical protein
MEGQYLLIVLINRTLLGCRGWHKEKEIVEGGMSYDPNDGVEGLDDLFYDDMTNPCPLGSTSDS